TIAAAYVAFLASRSSLSYFEVAVRHPAPKEISSFPADHGNPHHFSDMRLRESQGSIQIQRTEIGGDAQRYSSQSEACRNDPESPFQNVRPRDLQSAAFRSWQERRSRYSQPQQQPCCSECTGDQECHLPAEPQRDRRDQQRRDEGS